MTAKQGKWRTIAALLAFLWLAGIVAAFYGVQKPIAAAITRGLIETGWTVAVAGLLVTNGAGVAYVVLEWLWPAGLSPTERLLLGAGLGLGFLGLSGLGAEALGITAWPVLLLIQLVAALLLWRRGVSSPGSGIQRLWHDLRYIGQTVRQTAAVVQRWIPAAVVLTFGFAALLTLTPPTAFDSLLYHLTQPAWVLRDGGLRPYNVSPFWHPGLVEGAYFWTLGLGTDRAARVLHLCWTVLAALLVWQWATHAWDEHLGWLSLLILVSMPSLPLVASWAYTDFALAFYSVATIYAVWRWRSTNDAGWLVLGGIVAGMSMGVKYTSFVVPVTAGLLIVWWSRDAVRTALTRNLAFGLPALLVAAPWYLRNWALMENPVYPFVFGGRYWDAFRAAWYAEAGTGIGWDLQELLLLPVTTTLGLRDATFHDGRIGPLYLMLLPATLWAIWRSRRARGVPARGEAGERRDAVVSIALFAGLGGLFWTLGAINSSALWQARLLFPTLFPVAILTALGMEALQELDTPVLRLSWVARLIVAGVIALTLLEIGLFVVARNPLAVATGLESRRAYVARVQPGYAGMHTLLEQTPANARIYFLYEPRSYGLPRTVQPDPLLDNLAHGLYRYGNVQAFATALQQEGYTHVLLYRWGVDFLSEHEPDKVPPTTLDALERLTTVLTEAAGATADGRYELYALVQGETPE